MGRLKRKKTLLKLTGKQKMKQGNVILRFTSITGMMRNMNKLRRTPEFCKEKKKIAEPENSKEEEIEKNEEIFMLELQSEDNEKKVEVVGKADNEKQATKKLTVNKNMILNKDANIENTESEGEVKREDEQYGKSNQQCQKHQKVIADETKTKDKEKENQGNKTKEEDKNHKQTQKNNETRHKTFQITSGKFGGQKNRT